MFQTSKMLHIKRNAFLYVTGAFFLVNYIVALVRYDLTLVVSGDVEEPALASSMARHRNETTTTIHSGRSNLVKIVSVADTTLAESIDPTFAVALEEATPKQSRATVLDCLLQLEKPLMDLQLKWHAKEVPIMHSMVQVNETYKVVFIMTTNIKPILYESWTRDAIWKCDGARSPTHDLKIGNRGIFVLECPLNVENITVKRTASPDLESYDTALLRQCSDSDPSRGLPPGPLHKVACNMIRHTYQELREWLEYHRLLGYDHFLIYVNEPFNATLLPQSSDITYIPWDYAFRNRLNGIPHQGAQQQDCILRAQARNVTWLALHDVDEYIRVLDNTTSLDAVLRSHENDSSLGGLQLPSWFFGGKNTKLTTATDPSSKDALVIDRVWRTPAPFGRGPGGLGGREKLFVRPHQVQSFGCHTIMVGGPMKDESRLRLHHYKWVGGGVATFPDTLVHDDSLPTKYGSVLRQRMRTAEASGVDQ